MFSPIRGRLDWLVFVCSLPHQASSTPGWYLSGRHDPLVHTPSPHKTNWSGQRPHLEGKKIWLFTPHYSRKYHKVFPQTDFDSSSKQRRRNHKSNTTIRQRTTLIGQMNNSYGKPMCCLFRHDCGAHFWRASIVYFSCLWAIFSNIWPFNNKENSLNFKGVKRAQKESSCSPLWSQSVLHCKQTTKAWQLSCHETK